jgi:hypothetical protein
MLIIDDHGGGWRGACEDEQNGSGNLMTMVDMAAAIRQSLTSAGIDKFDVITFHACLMSMVEVAYELRNCANYLVASDSQCRWKACSALTLAHEYPDIPRCRK